MLLGRLLPRRPKPLSAPSFWNTSVGIDNRQEPAAARRASLATLQPLEGDRPITARVIETGRLSIVACPLEVADALVGNRAEAERLARVSLPGGWPDPELLGFLPVYSGELRTRPDALGYGVWLLIDRDTRMIVGSAGFQGLPDADGEIEIGYGIDPSQRRQGYGTEAVCALLAWGLDQPGVVRVIAHCDLGNTDSIGVLSKAGFRADGEKDGLSRFVAP